jgi:ABC-type nitrate/sulfonate/bicarbonate transport system ATPase subunit
MHNFLQNSADKGMTVVMVSSDNDELLEVCDRIYVLSGCPTVVRLEIAIPFRRPSHGRTIIDPAYGAIRDKVMEALEI